MSHQLQVHAYSLRIVTKSGNAPKAGFTRNSFSLAVAAKILGMSLVFTIAGAKANNRGSVNIQFKPVQAS